MHDVFNFVEVGQNRFDLPVGVSLELNDSLHVVAKNAWVEHRPVGLNQTGTFKAAHSAVYG